MIDGQVVVASSLERLTRVKWDILFPLTRMDLEILGWKADPSIYVTNVDLPWALDENLTDVDLGSVPKFNIFLDYLLEASGITLQDVDCVAWSYRHNDSAKRYFLGQNPNIDFVVPEHHHAHACQAFLPSPYEEAAIMVVDGQGVPLERTGGDQLSGCLAYGKGTTIETLWELPVRHSLGGMYAEFTKAVGFKTNEEGKAMGLAPYGGPEYYDVLRKDLKFETKEYGLRELAKLAKRGFRAEEVLYQLPKYGRFLSQFKYRSKGEEITDVHRNLAYAVQKLTEDVMIFLADWLHANTESENLVITGGVALNCVANYEVLVKSKFKNIWVYPNAGDNGLVVGQALYLHNQVRGNPRTYVATTDSMGREYSVDQVREAVAEAVAQDANLEVQEFADLSAVYPVMAQAIADGKITSWCQGRSEFGPRALGNRSIIADPRREDMKDVLNSRVKFRESFRPFTPSVLAEHCIDYFELDLPSPFMLMAAYVKPGMEKVVPAITHVDNTARVQTVTRDVNERYYDLIKAFGELTGVWMVLNTSFNVAGEPIVETPADAIRCFRSTDIDMLCLDRFILTKRVRTGGTQRNPRARQ
ncbi:MAG: carbamoyltransferase family protein [Longimicrobiales bacterium]